jgi:hypothetical protein
LMPRVQHWKGGQSDRVPIRLWNDSQPCCFMLSEREGPSPFLHLIAWPCLVSTRPSLCHGICNVCKQAREGKGEGMVRQGKVWSATCPSFGLGSACCIEDFLVGLFLPDEGGEGKAQPKGATFRISFHFISRHWIQGNGREGRLFSQWELRRAV